jgi:hypothetical protein
VLAAQIHLDDRRVVGQELPVREVGAEHQQRVAPQHRPIAGREAEQPGHADVERVVVLDELLAPQSMDDRRLELFRQRDELRVRPLRAGAGQDRHPAAPVDHGRRLGDPGVVRPDHGAAGTDHRRFAGVDRAGREDLARYDDHGDAALLDGVADRHLEDPRREWPRTCHLC